MIIQWKGCVVYTGRVSYEVVMPLWNRNMIDFILNDFMITNLILKHFISGIRFIYRYEMHS